VAGDGIGLADSYCRSAVPLSR